MPHATSSQGVSPARVLFIDAYDSFTNNVVSLLETQLGVEVTVIHIDDEIVDFATFLEPFAAVVAGPGPGDPRNPKDVGLIRDVWKLNASTTLLPVLGICLGFQSLVLHFGGSIERLPEPRHGIVRKVRSQCQSIFRDHDFVDTIVYHSLHASLRHSNSITMNDIWRSSSECPNLRPLAYDYEIDQQNLGIPAGEETCCPGAEGQRRGADGCAVCDAGKPLEESSSALLPNYSNKYSSPILMAVEHISKPFVGLQFHPESICSSENARAIIALWWDDAMHWNTKHRNRMINPESPTLGRLAGNINNMWNDIERSGDFNQVPPVRNTSASPDHARPKLQVHTRVIEAGALSVASICEVLGLTKGNAIILDSEMHQRHEVGQYSIIGVTTPDTIRIEYKVGLPTVQLTCSGKVLNEDFGYGGSIFSYLSRFMRVRQAETGHTKVPFSGGLIGYISYEACLETIGINKASTNSITKSSREQPDLSFAFVERSIVIDHFQQTLHVQSTRANDIQWVNDTARRLQESTSITQRRKPTTLPRFEAHIILPNEEKYKSKVRTCQSFIRAGDAYELCLTTQATIKTSTRLPSWPLYQRLRKLNPSPFSAYMCLGKLTLLCSSPERFVRWSRPTTHGKDDGRDDASVNGQKTSICQFRPIKGTVQRQPNPNLPPLSLAEATALLSTPKERAENLMIVDLIRHDLHGVVGSGRVSVPKLMVVEEYATLFQLVSVIEGNLLIEESKNEFDGTPATRFDRDPAMVAKHDGAYKDLMGTVNNFTHSEAGVGLTTTGKTVIVPKDTLGFPKQRITNRQYPYQEDATKTGIDVLASSLPPGSMTGSPKLRSCQILGEIEKRERGIYSGVVGYMDVGGGGDFNVVIRSAFRWDDEDSPHAEEGGEHAVERKDGDECGEECGTGDMWTIGAGGAVTILSTEEGEWEEMVAKLKSTLRLFENGDGEQMGKQASH